jgi:hypothetical protein
MPMKVRVLQTFAVDNDAEAIAPAVAAQRAEGSPDTHTPAGRLNAVQAKVDELVSPLRGWDAHFRRNL